MQGKIKAKIDDAEFKELSDYVTGLIEELTIAIDKLKEIEVTVDVVFEEDDAR